MQQERMRIYDQNKILQDSETVALMVPAPVQIFYFTDHNLGKKGSLSSHSHRIIEWLRSPRYASLTTREPYPSQRVKISMGK